VTGKTIVYLPNWIGDMVMAVPFLESLRASVNDEIWGIGKSNAIHIYNGLNLLDRYIPLDKKDIVSFFDAVSFLKKTEFKRGILLPHSFRSALLFYMAGIKERIGYARNKRGFMLTKHAPETLTLESTTRHYMRIIDMLGGRRTENETPLLSVTQDEELRYYEQYTDLDKPYIVFVIGAQYGSSKCWPPVYFSELADMIVQRLEMMVYLLPGKDEKGLARDVLDGSIQKEGIEIMDMDVRDLKVCLSRASLVVSNDTGPRHISAALSVPTVVLLGPMDARYTDYPSAYTHLISADIPCRPCNRRVCDRDHGCMKQITPETVFRKLEEILG
jgi:heptosyltransferase-2